MRSLLILRAYLAALTLAAEWRLRAWREMRSTLIEFETWFSNYVKKTSFIRYNITMTLSVI